MPAPGEPMTPELVEVEKEIRELILDSRLPAPIANFIIKEIAATGPAWQSMSGAEQDLTTQRARVALEKIWGTSYDENMKVTKAYIADLDKKHGGKVSDLLQTTGGGSQPGVILNIHLHAQRVRGHAK
jgi:hypothetical protein